jgi:RNA polymerase sigma-70 factor (ECF subfamily)
MEEPGDQALADGVARGDAEALRTLYRRYAGQTFNLLLRLTGNRELAEDMLQEAFTRVWTMAGRFDAERGGFRGWLFTIALNLTRNELARRRHSATHVEPEAVADLASPADGPEALAARSEARHRVAAALAALAPHLREIVVLRVYHQLTFREIAAITRTPEGTLKARFHRAVNALRGPLAPLWSRPS